MLLSKSNRRCSRMFFGLISAKWHYTHLLTVHFVSNIDHWQSQNQTGNFHHLGSRWKRVGSKKNFSIFSPKRVWALFNFMHLSFNRFCHEIQVIEYSEKKYHLRVLCANQKSCSVSSSSTFCRNSWVSKHLSSLPLILFPTARVRDEIYLMKISSLLLEWWKSYRMTIYYYNKNESIRNILFYPSKLACSQ